MKFKHIIEEYKSEDLKKPKKLSDWEFVKTENMGECIDYNVKLAISTKTMKFFEQFGTNKVIRTNTKDGLKVVKVYSDYDLNPGKWERAVHIFTEI